MHIWTQDHGNIILPLKEDNLSITVKLPHLHFINLYLSASFLTQLTKTKLILQHRRDIKLAGYLAKPCC